MNKINLKIIGLLLVMALFITGLTLANYTPRNFNSGDGLQNTNQNTNSKNTNSKKKNKGNSNSNTNDNMDMNSNTSPNTNGTPRS